MSVDLLDYARGIVMAETLDGKLAPVPGGWHEHEGVPERADVGEHGREHVDPDVDADADWVPITPGRPPELAIHPWAGARTPSLRGWPDPAQRWRILHALANHELQAVELFAWALLAFPHAPAGFRAGLLGILADEQRHCALYIDRLGELGHAFGDAPVSGYFWGKLQAMSTPARFVVAMGLIFENANLDHALEAAEAAEACGDVRSAGILRRVQRDEVRHVAFAWRWLEAFRAPDQAMWDAFLEHSVWPLRPALARGRSFDAASREAAGLDAAFIERLAQADRERRTGALSRPDLAAPEAGPA